MNYWRQQAMAIHDKLIQMRRHIHRYPELGYKEVNTASYLAGILQKQGIHVEQNVGGTGLVATIDGAARGRVIALRADMDALPVHEKTAKSYSSTITGISHACGHDAHSAMLAGAAMLLQKHRRQIAGTIKCIFQAAEECPPLGGILPMIEDGVLENPKVDAAYALHVTPDLPVGTIGIAPGLAMAASDRVEIKILGAGGHGSAPHQGVDAVLVAAHTVVALQSIVSRNTAPYIPAVLGIGLMRAGYRYNVIADTASLDCTVRTVDSYTRQLMQDKIEQIVDGVTKAMGASYELRYTTGYPPASNYEEQVDQVIRASEYVLGEDSVRILEQPSLTGEDFANFLERIPGAFFWLGSRMNDGHKQYPVHHPSFDINEAVLPLGTSLFCRLIEQELYR